MLLPHILSPYTILLMNLLDFNFNGEMFPNWVPLKPKTAGLLTMPSIISPIDTKETVEPEFVTEYASTQFREDVAETITFPELEENSPTTIKKNSAKLNQAYPFKGVLLEK